MTDLSKLSRDQLVALVAQMEKQAAAKVSFKVTDKGGVSVYGIGRFPVTLYKSQWDALLANADGLRAFLDANADKLATKPAKS